MKKFNVFFILRKAIIIFLLFEFLAPSVSADLFSADSSTEDNNSSYYLYKTTDTFCQFQIELSTAIQKPNIKYLFQSDGKIIKSFSWGKEFGYKTGPVSAYLSIKAYFQSGRVDEKPEIPIYNACENVLPSRTKRGKTPEGFVFKDHRQCDSISNKSDAAYCGEDMGYMVDMLFPHEVIVRLYQFPACVVKLDIELPIIFEQDLFKKNCRYPEKDTPVLKKKKQEIRSMMLRTLNSFKYLGKNQKPKLEGKKTK
ncbi:MAG: hypothetical protein HY747_02180 [Elusimicrobia bacterium]|nr:hypothetical protein [Elusimicrobiota bacterium]